MTITVNKFNLRTYFEYLMNCKRVVFMIVLLLQSFYGFTQSNLVSSIESAEIKWVGQFPAPNDSRLKQHHSFISILKTIIGVKRRRSSISYKPVGLLATSPDVFWFVDQNSETIQRVDKNTCKPPPAFHRQKFIFQSLVGLCSFTGKGILFTDSRLNKIFKLSNNQKSITEFNQEVTLNQPTGIAFSKRRAEVWVIETASHKVTIMDTLGKKIRSFGGRGAGNGEFNFPTSVWMDNKGFVYINDALNYRIQIFDDLGNFISSFGQAGNATGYFALPKSVATDSYDDIYVVDALLHTVQIFDKGGRFLLSFGSQGREKEKFWLPSSIYVDEHDYIYVADSYNARIQIFKLDKIVLRHEN